MWTRKELKMKGRICLNRNYWRTVLISFILMLILGGGSGAVSGRGINLTWHMNPNSGSGISQNAPNPDLPFPIPDAGQAGGADIGSQLEQTLGNMPPVAIIAAVIAAVVVIMIITAIALAFAAFLANPLELGARRFFLTNLNRSAEVREIGFAFDHSYMNIVKTLFLRDLYLILWTMLFVIPGIIKAYEYRMIPYILADRPNITTKEAFALSRAMMRGNKWRAFVLDLSFILWYILSAFTLGILAVFYVNPYRNMTCAALYEALNPKFNPEEFVPKLPEGEWEDF